MPNLVIGPPEPGEAASFQQGYINHVQSQDILTALAEQIEETKQILSLSEEQAGFRYAPDKWSIKEMIGHLSDTERIWAYRILRFARNDASPLQAFEQNAYVQYSNADRRTLSDLIAEYVCVRQSTLFLLRNLDQEAWMRRGIASGAETSVRAIAYSIAGHELHHRAVLQDRYFPALPAAQAKPAAS